MTEISPPLRRIHLAGLAIVFIVGIFLRLPSGLFVPGAPLRFAASLHPQAAFKGAGLDEVLYRTYVEGLSNGGIASYPDMVEGYIEAQQKREGALLPPLRFLYVFTAHVWNSVFGCGAGEALRQVSACFSILTLGLTTLFAWRLRGASWALGTAAFMAVAPTQLHMSQHGLIDGFFAFWTLLCLWLLWETLNAPGDRRWLVAYALGLAVLVITKENSFFAWAALVALILANRWLRFGTVTRELVLATVAGPMLGVVILVFLSGGLGNFITTYQLLVSKASQMSYAISTGDGPWHRYLVDLLLVSPVVLVLAIGAIFRLDRTKKPELFLSIFIAVSYLLMCNVKYGMNLRYANMWDMPLRFLAFGTLVLLTAPLRRYRNAVLVASVAAICAIELRQYVTLAVQYPLYELVPEDLLRALHILK